MPTKSRKPAPNLPYWPKKLLAESKIFGGKSYLARRIHSHAPKGYTRFLDGFGGMGSLTYNAPAGLKEQVFIEKNWFRYNAKWAIKHHLEGTLSFLSDYSHDEEHFKDLLKLHEINKAAVAAGKIYSDTLRVQIAAMYIALTKMSRGGMPECGFSFTPTTTRLRGGQQAEKNAWEGMVARLPALSERLQPVDIINGLVQPFLRLIECPERKPREWWCYLDPCYLPAVRSTNADEYGDDEMTFQQHEELVAQVKSHPAKIAISHYPHPLYDGLGWHRIDFDMPNHSGQNKKKQRRTESLYTNYLPVTLSEG